MSSKLGFLLNYEEGSLNLVPSKAQKRVPLTKKQKRVVKKAEYEAKKQGIVSQPDGKIGKSVGEETENNDVENVERQAFTPGWEKSFTVREALPIKTHGKVIRTLREVSVEEDDESDDGESEPQVNDKKRKKPQKQVKELTGNDSDIEKSDVDGDDEDDDDDDSILDYPYNDSDNDEEREEQEPKRAKQQKDSKWSQKDSEQVKDGDDDEKPAAKKPKISAAQRMLAAVNINNAKRIIGEICSTITADPEKCFRKKKDSAASAIDNLMGVEDAVYNIADLLALLQHPDQRIAELTMLSALIVFKDVIPGYRIRPPTESEQSVQLKKETKRLRDFEQTLLSSYQKYLKFLDSKAASGLKNPRKEVPQWDVAAKLGLSALRCLCELLRSVPHFNYRTMLLTAVVTRSAQPSDQVHSLCCETLIHMFKSDVEAEVSYETVKLISKILAVAKYEVPEPLLRVLESVKLRVHADDAKGIRRKAKQERRKRKKDEDEAEFVESNAVADKNTALRFQADTLHEICLIYFRIVKMKVGFTLLPVALEGLGRITHLINIDTVSDLMALLGTVIKNNPPPPPLVQLHCIHCALKTLSGPGAELKLDDEVYIGSLRDLMKELTVDFLRWDLILECLDLCLFKRREPRSNVVVNFVRLLLVNSCHMFTTQTANALLAGANMILLKYPRVRMELLALTATAPGATTLQQRLSREEDQVGDLAMKALKDSEGGSSSHTHLEAGDGDGSWLLPLLRMHIDKHVHKVVISLTSKEVATIPIRMTEAHVNQDRVLEKIDIAFSMLPSPQQRQAAAAGAGGGGNGSAGRAGNGNGAGKGTAGKLPGSQKAHNNNSNGGSGGNNRKQQSNKPGVVPNSKAVQKEFKNVNKKLGGGGNSPNNNKGKGGGFNKGQSKGGSTSPGGGRSQHTSPGSSKGKKTNFHGASSNGGTTAGGSSRGGGYKGGSSNSSQSSPNKGHGSKNNGNKRQRVA